MKHEITDGSASKELQEYVRRWTGIPENRYITSCQVSSTNSRIVSIVTDVAVIGKETHEIGDK